MTDAPAAARALTASLASLVGAEHVLAGAETGPYLADATEARGLRGHAEAVVCPGDAGEVAAVLAWCNAHDMPIVPRGGGTGFAGGAVPVDGGVVLSLERLAGIRRIDPLRWQLEVEAGVTTADVRRLARENGLWFPPDPGAGEQSHIGGNVATNAGGPHAFKYGVTGHWVTGLEAVVMPGDLIRLGGAVRKDVAGYDLRSLLIGSEGTLGIVTAVSLRLIPGPEAAFPVAGAYPSVVAGCNAVAAAMACGVVPAAIEYLDGATARLSRGGYPGPLGAGVEMLVIAEADGDAEEAARGRELLQDALAEGATSVYAPAEASEIAALWRWRDGVSLLVTAARGGKVSEDVAVPVDRLEEAITGTLEIGRRHGLEACSWGHAGDGNLHSSFLLDPASEGERAAAAEAADDLFALAVHLGGTISGEHGLGVVKNGQLRRQWGPRAVELHEAVKRAFDPKGLLNAGKKLA
jgi:glycolate oxidase subunit GlcD